MINKILKIAKDDQVLTKKADRNNVFRIQRFKNDHGFYVYALENVAETRKIFIPRFVFGRFRGSIRAVLEEEIKKPKSEPFERSASFLNQEYFFFKSSRMDLDNLIIQDVEERKGSSGYITVSRRCLHALDSLLYADALGHPNDVLEEIISYHKLFQFSFVKGSKSITSDLSLRKDVLQEVTNYRPSLAEKLPLGEVGENADGKNEAAASGKLTDRSAKKDGDLYRPKLGERFHEKNIKVDYGEIFGDKKISLNSPSEKESDKKEKNDKSPLSQFPVPLSSLEIKTFGKGKFYFELNTDQSNEFRSRFIGDRHCEFYIGFEVVDTLFTFNRALKSFRFPLYYMKVRIRESGRGVHLESTEDGRIYLNHLALAHLVEKFSEKVVGVDHSDSFFKTLLAQHISIDRLNDRITLTRRLPISEEIFDRTREVLFGYKDDNGKGGILGDLNFSGIECDLHSVILYRAPKLLSPIDQALENDLDKIHTIAHHATKRFYQSLLGRFLTPELDLQDDKNKRSETKTWVPGCLPKSTRNLLDRLRTHDLVLLEGPPGTGKTHTIMNLLIHCICTKQRVLIVSDQRAAIEALIEKMQEYLVGSDIGTPAETVKKELLYSAIKVIDEVQVEEQNLADVVDKLTKAFKAQDQGSTMKRENIDKKLDAVKQKISRLTIEITKKMQMHMSEDLPFDKFQPHKDDGRDDIFALQEFLSLVGDDKNPNRRLIDRFVSGRETLLNDGMEECYSYFKIPSRSIDHELQSLREDIVVLTSIVGKKIETSAQFQSIIKDCPKHELVRYLESVFVRQVEEGERGLKTLKKVTRIIQPGFRSPLQKEARFLLGMVKDHIAILEKWEMWPENVWHLLREIHECIRLSDKPNRALALYYSVVRQSETSASAPSLSIQGDLEQIDDLYQQQDKLVYEQFVTCLQDVSQQATLTRRGQATNAVTRIVALAESLKQFGSVNESGEVFEEFKQVLYETFPIWIARKQVVPFILPCTENSFDLIVIDEATQCRVDDAMSLLYRAKKILVVGDDKQTVLQKDSTIDDYLFKDHELDEHLRSTQARGFKGGGSHIFALIKSIKQASVMLDEHYRCPADIIEFSNKYVYNNELKVMQWSLPEQPASVVIDDSEQYFESSKKPSSGKFKGIETEMVDRFFDYVSARVRKIEKATGKRVNLETDVALCYFLLKNEPYVKLVKEKFISSMNRGEDVLDGAGAALQGKERDYIFYLWDITRYNLGAFKQGDDEDKRKGELNVLMSRPKKMAFHFLHRTFDQLEHGRCSITHYLSRSLAKQQRKSELNKRKDSNEEPSLFASLLKFTLGSSGQRGLKEVRRNVADDSIDFRENIAVGDARKIVDLIAFSHHESKRRGGKVVGLVDLSGFNADPEIGDVIVDYYFQLKRAAPKIAPVFLFPYELLDENCQSFRSLLHKMEALEIR